ncbi:unnamed protein product (macronuclear) [Paramecium tetraurelia]|uniref:Uncharacterized protein n=1 Tax=Paramecium tetraurelia TaxID=5888 RepID=A0EEL6_PARTE|nr:uncharacterized protein GSPATT00026079001 [Paramecium tetraurelia]CAK93754.1 unnamed protein product [Paramecium tetraurelia]|eukprot:XP_001461130.1 hypothetical protein (macronuclear) [Paramecium tetraurelia strain d4-2]
MQRTLEQRQTTEQIRRNNNQNNADLLLSVYELTARSSLQIGQRPRQQSQSREKYKFKQCEQKKVDLMSISSPGSQKKLPLSPQLKLQSPREPGLIFNLIRAANNAIENNTDDKIIRTYMQIRTQVEMRLDVLESADSLAVQLEKIKQENDTLRKRVSDNINSQSLSNLAQLKMQLQKAEKKAESRKVCIKKLYQLLDKSEKELELYKSGKKSAKTSFSKKNELNEILNGTYPKNKENIPDTYEPMLLSLIKDIDQKNYEAIENLSKNNSLNTDVENEKNNLISNSLKSFKLMCEQKEEILKYSAQICENNQDLWKKFLEIDLTCQKQISTLRQAISELETNIKSYYQYLNKIGHNSAQKFQDAYQFQGVIGDSIAKWLKQLGEIQEIINQRESEQYEFQQFQETLVMRLKEIIQNNKIVHKQNDFKGLLDAINERLFNQSEEILLINKELNNTHIKAKQQIEELQNKFKLEFQNYELQLKNYKELYDQLSNTNKELVQKNENLQVEFNRQTQISVTALQNKQQEILNLNEQTKKLKEDITKSQELKLTYNEQQTQINQFKKEIERLNQVILQNQSKSSQQEENLLTVIEQNKSEITRLHQLIIDLHSQIEQSDNQIQLLKEAEQIIKDKITKDSLVYSDKVKKLQEIIQNKEIEHSALEEEYKAIQSQNVEFYSQQQQDQDTIKLMKKDLQKNQEQYEQKINEFIKLSERQLAEIKDLSEKYQQAENERRNQDETITKLKKELLKQTNDHQKQVKTLQDQQKQSQEMLQQKLQSFERLNEQNQMIICEQKKLLHESQAQLQKVNLENEALLQNNSESMQSMKEQYELLALELNQTKQVVLDQQELIQNQQLLHHDTQQECYKFKKQIEQQDIVNKQNQSELGKTIQDQINLINQLKSNLEATEKRHIENKITAEQLSQTLITTQSEITQLRFESTQLNNTIEQNSKTIQDLQSQLQIDQQQHEIELKQIQKNLDLVQNQSNQEKESIILELHKQIQEFQEQLQNQRDQYQHDVQQHQIQIKLNQERFDLVLQQEINQINCQMEQQISTKEEEKQGFLDQIKALENKIVQLDQKNKEIYLQSQSNQNLYRQLIEQLETLQQESQNEQLKWKDLLQQKDEKIRTIEINSKSEIGKLNEQLIHTSERRAQIEQDQIKLIEQEQITNQELQKLKEQLEQKQNEIDSIDKLLNERVLDNEELNGKLILVSKEMSLYKDQNKDLQSQISQQSESNSNTINELKFKIKEQDFLINQLQSQVKDFECQMNLQLSEVILQSKDLVNKKQQELDISSNELTQLKNQFIKLQNENDDLLKQITILQEINNNKDIQINDFENQVTKLHEQVNTINNYNQLKQEELDNVLNLLKNREQQIADQNELINNLQILQVKQEQDYNEKLNNLNQVSMQSSSEQSELKQIVEQVQMEKEKITEELLKKNENLKEIVKNQQTTCQQLNEQLSSKDTELQEQGILIEQYQSQVLQLNEELTLIMDEKSQQNLKIHQLRTNIEKIQQDLEVKSIQLQNSDLESENQKQQFESQLNELGNQNKELFVRLSELQEENSTLIEQVRKRENEYRLKVFEMGEKNRFENEEQNKINQILQQELSISEVSEENVINALSQIKNEFQELLDKQSQYSTLIFQLYSELLTDDEEEDVEKQIQVISNQMVGLIDVRDKYKKIENEFEGEGDILVKIKELKLSEQKKQSSNSQDIKSIEAYSQLLDGLMQEFLHNRVNLTMQSMKSLLTEQQRQNVNEYRKKIGELQNKLLQAEKQQKCIDDTKFNLQQYQQIVDKSEQKAMYYEMECKKLVQQIQEMKQRMPQRISLNDLDQDQSEQHSLNILNFSLRQEILYGDDSFFDNISQIKDDDVHSKCQQQIFHLVEECQLLQEQLNMQREDRNVQIK